MLAVKFLILDILKYMKVYEGICWLFWVYLAPYGHAGPSGDMVERFVPNSVPGGCSGAPVMVFFVSHVGPHFANIGYSEVYEGI